MSDEQQQRLEKLERELAETKMLLRDTREVLDGLQQMLLESVYTVQDEEMKAAMIEYLEPMARIFSPEKYAYGVSSLSGSEPASEKLLRQAWYYPYWRFWRYLLAFRAGRKP